MMRKDILIFLFLLIAASLNAQSTKKIRLVSADKASYDDFMSKGIEHINGNAIFEHEGAYLYCDSALYNEPLNNINCYGHVRIKSGDTLNLYGDQIDYAGDTRIAKVTGKIVKLIDKTTTLTTDYLFYNRVTNAAYYETGGVVISKENRLTSKKGYYYTDKKEYVFFDNVVLKNKRYEMLSDSMNYHSDTRIAEFKGPTTIKGKDQNLYCERGWYNTTNDLGSLMKNAKIINDNRVLTGDSLYFDRPNDIGKGYRNVKITDTTNNIILKGNYGEIWNKKGFGFLTQKALAIMIEKKKDSLFLHGDTLRATFDTAHNMKAVFAYHKVKFFRDSLQGMCDSMVYISKDSVLHLYHSPIIWSGKNQLSADTIRLFTHNKEMARLEMYNTSFIISRDSTTNFNQIKGRTMTGFFKKNQIYRINVDGSAESLYYVRQDDHALIGVNKGISSNLIIYIDESNKIHKITWIKKPVSVLYPLRDLPEDEKRLRDFKWVEEGRPQKKEDVFK